MKEVEVARNRHGASLAPVRQRLFSVCLRTLSPYRLISTLRSTSSSRRSQRYDPEGLTEARSSLKVR